MTDYERKLNSIPKEARTFDVPFTAARFILRRQRSGEIKLIHEGGYQVVLDVGRGENLYLAPGDSLTIG